VEEQGKIRLMQQLANGVDSASCMGTGFPNPRNKSAYLIGEKARLLKAVNVLHGFTREKSFNPRFVGENGVLCKCSCSNIVVASPLPCVVYVLP
jgi:hypothetical protein